MAEQITEKKFRFIPYRRQDIIEMCLREQRLQGQEKEFRHLCGMIGSIFHFEFHRIIESLKRSLRAD